MPRAGVGLATWLIDLLWRINLHTKAILTSRTFAITNTRVHTDPIINPKADCLYRLSLQSIKQVLLLIGLVTGEKYLIVLPLICI